MGATLTIQRGHTHATTSRQDPAARMWRQYPISKRYPVKMPLKKIRKSWSEPIQAMFDGVSSESWFAS